MKRIYEKSNYKDLRKWLLEDASTGMMIAIQTAIFLFVLFMMLNDI
jgi:hypothetical protein